MSTPLDIDVSAHRQPTHPVEPVFVERWSARAMSGEPLEPDDALSLFEAARWAPSSRNLQPWRFFYAVRDDAHWRLFLDLLVESNRSWAHRAALMVVVASVTHNEDGDPHPTHAFEAGLATQNLLLQATLLRLVGHPMRGFDLERARTELGMPEGMVPHAMVAVARPGEITELTERQQARERPSGRRPLGEIVIAGRWIDG